MSSDRRHYPIEHLGWIERWSIWVIRAMNEPGRLQRIAMWWGAFFCQRIFRILYQRRWQIHGEEILRAMQPNAGVLVVANHRSFFDLFVAMTALRDLSAQSVGYPCVFPVRSPFFYDSILGVPLNILASGGCMWPPVFRDERKKNLKSNYKYKYELSFGH